MEQLKQKIEQSLILHRKVNVTNQEILLADQGMINALFDQRLNSKEKYEELNKWFIKKTSSWIESDNQKLEQVDLFDTEVDREIYNLVKQLPDNIQKDIWRLNSGSKKQLRAKILIHTEDSNDYKMAALIELFHLATLIQDDVIDQANIRRHTETLNCKYGNNIAILISDVLLVNIISGIKEEIELRFEKERNTILEEYFQDKTKDMVDSLINSETSVRNIKTLEDYEQYAIDKTAKLFSYSMLVGALSKLENNITVSELDVLYEIGLEIGLLFQKVDDYIDFSAEVDLSGKDSRDIENNIKNYMYFQSKKSSKEEIKTDLIMKVNKCIENYSQYTEELTIIKRSIQ